MNYRRDIDGLRALAIAPVVIYHAGLPLFSGGFVGVDVFFVISGFLITSLITKEMDDDRFSLLNFYERRIRRLFPALFLVIAATLLCGWAIYSPLLFKGLSHSAIWTSFFSSNFFFWNESDYFSGASATKPLLHTWSLAVEEQFYVLFPLMLLALRRLRHRNLLMVLAVLVIASFIGSVWAVARAPSFAFYLLPTRFWELLLGAMLAIAAPAAPMAKWQRTTLTAVGLLAILLPAMIYTSETDFPGLATLPPCLGTLALIYAGSADSDGWHPLRSRVAVFIGLISYPLYLWHWPLLVFWAYWTGSPLSALQAVVVIGLSCVLAWLTFRFVERPFRRRIVVLRRMPLFGAGFAAMVVTAMVGFGISKFDGFPSRLPQGIRDLYIASLDHGRFTAPDCINRDGREAAKETLDQDAGCKLGKASTSPDFVVWGDSHATAIAPGIDKLATELGVSGVLLARSSCAPLLKFHLQKNASHGKQCEIFNDSVLKYIKERRIQGVILVARWPRNVHRSGYGNEGIFFRADDAIDLTDHSAPIVKSLNETLSVLSDNGSSVSIVYDVPEIGFNVPDALARAAMTGTNANIAPDFQAVMRRQALSRKVISEAALKYQAMITDPATILCDSKICHVRNAEGLFYADEDHLNTRGAKLIRTVFKPFMQKLGATAAQ
jgi:peptidoglycan/LPS O-acetylase OafA/YrhL